MSTSQEGPQCRHCPVLADQLIDASGAHATDRITIAGSRHLDLLLALLGRGFTHAACQAVNQECPHDAASAADILLIPDLADEADLTAVLARLGPVLRSGGTLVLHFDGTQNAVTRLRRLLVERGYLPASWMGASTQADDWILCARKRPATLHAQAA